MWFETLTGFREEHSEQVRSNLSIRDETMVSRANGRSMRHGRLDTPRLADLQAEVQSAGVLRGSLNLSEVVADVQQLHADAANGDALFQVASQFNLLEMVHPEVTPEHGVGIYESDPTQGPACAISCGAGTIYRNYFAPVNGCVGQTEDNQIDCLHELGIALGNSVKQHWTMQNGYALATAEGLAAISHQLSAADESERDRFRGLLRIGLQWNTQVTLGDATHTVSQAYCSALPVAYSPHASEHWADFAQLVLEASYEATLCAASVNLANTGNNKVFLTLLGGGAFGNKDDWIFGAIRRAIDAFADVDLDVSIVSYGASNPRVQQLFADVSGNWS